MKRTLRLLLTVGLSLVCVSLFAQKFPNYPIPQQPDTLRILGIGNSFTDDGMMYLPELLEAAGIRNVVLGRLYIAGCSLERHCREYAGNAPAYIYYKSTSNRWETVSKKATLLDGIADERWDVVVLQQASGKSGIYPTYQPWFGRLVEIVRWCCPNAGACIAWQQTWAYARNSQHRDYATITYTSGTTSDPKGVILTHRNYTANVEQALSRVDIPPHFRTLIILPLDHCFAHVVGFYIMIACGASVATVQIGATPMETLKNIPQNIREVQPHFLLSVPALAKNFRKNIESSIRAKGRFTEALFNLALRTAYAYNSDGYGRGSGWRIVLAPVVGIFDALLFRKVRQAFGGHLEFFVGGGALLDAELQRFFYAIGIPMFQGYGLSEATPVISTNSPKHHWHRFGSSGKILIPLDLKILDEEGREVPRGQKGEIVVRGENVMAGYWKNPGATAETVRDGWLHTGDMGYVSEDDFLYVLGRFKSLLIASDGEKYSPEGMEEAIVDKSPYIDQIIVHNNQSPFTGAIVVPNREALRRELEARRTPEAERANVAAEILGAEIDRYRAGGTYAGEFPERWLPAGLAIVDEAFTEQNGLVNSTMKVVRGKVEEHFRNRLDYLYSAEGRSLKNPENLASLKKIVG